MTKALDLILAFICIIFLFGDVSAQDMEKEQFKLDSLKQLYQLETDHYKLVDLSNEIAYTYGIISIDSSLVYSKKALQLAKQINYTHGLGISHSYVARASAQIGEIKTALENFDKAIDIFSSEADSLNLLDNYRGIAYIASYSGNQLASLNYNKKALSLAEKLHDTLSLSIIYNNIASIYKRLDNFKLAIYYYEKTIEIEAKYQVPKDMAMTYSNMGVLSIENKKFVEAANYYQKIEELLPKIENTYVTAYLYLSLAGYYTAIDELEQAQQYVVQAEQICVQEKYKHVLARVYRQYGEVYLKGKQYEKSIQYFDKGITLSDAIGISEEYPRIYKMKAEAYAYLGKYPKAYQSLQKAIIAIDSLKSEKASNFLNEFEAQKAKEEVQQQKLELALKEQQAENTAIKLRNKFTSALTVIFILIFVIGIVAFYYFKSKKNNIILKSQHAIIKDQKLLLEENIQKLEVSEENLQKLNATKDKFFSIIAHDLKSPFNSIIGFSDELAQSYDKYSDEERLEMINLVRNASKSTYSLLENLLTWAQSQSGFIQIKKEALSIKELVDESIFPYLGAAEMKKIKVLNAFDDALMVWADKDTMKIVVSNLFNNAIKFCNNGGAIHLSCKLNNGMLEMCTRDTGIGMSEQIMNDLFHIEKSVQRKGTNQEKGTGLGLILCREFVHKNGGQIWVESEVGVGSSIYFSIPVHTSNEFLPSDTL